MKKGKLGDSHEYLEKDFQDRIDKFENSLSSKHKGQTISIKIRVTGGCFHREHSPIAYRRIDDYIHSSFNKMETLSFEEHESGPELLVCLALGTAGVTLAKSVIDLVTVIIKARSEGIKQGDRPREPIELIVRNFDENGNLREERVLRFNSDDSVEREIIEKALLNKVDKIITRNIKKNNREV